MTKNMKMNGQSLNTQEDLITWLKKKLPEAFTEGKIDCKKLKATLGESVDTNNERYGLSWAGKYDCFRHIQEPTTATLKPVRDESVDFDTTKNLFIEGDNLQVLKVLQKSYYGQVKMIYIDPPYNTGSDSFIYPDRFQETQEEYMERVGDKEEGHVTRDGMWQKNSGENGHYHSNWLSMMYPRLFLARNLLREDGVIFVSIDDHEMKNLGLLLDEIFGPQNFVACLSVVNNMKGRNDKKNVATAHEYLFIYSNGTFESYGLPLTEEQLKQYKYVDEKNEKYALRDLRKRGRPDRREDRPKMFFPIYFNEKNKTCSLMRVSKEDIEISPQKGDGTDGRWRWGKIKVATHLKHLQPRYSKSKSRWDVDHRVYLNDQSEVSDEEDDDDDAIFERTSKSKSFWWGGELSTDVGRRELKEIFPEIDFDYPKSPYLIRRLLCMATKNNDIVLDFFVGSGTTADSVMRLNAEDGGNRRCISVQLNEKCDDLSESKKAGFDTIADIARERIRRAGKKIKKETSKELDYGFKVLKLDESNFKIWRSDITDAKKLTEQMHIFIDNLKAKSTQENVLYELMLKTGLDLNVSVEEKKADGKKYFVLDGGKLIVCLEDAMTRPLANAVIALKPQKVICLDGAFKGNDQLKTNTALQMEAAKIDFRVI